MNCISKIVKREVEDLQKKLKSDYPKLFDRVEFQLDDKIDSELLPPEELDRCLALSFVGRKTGIHRYVITLSSNELESLWCRCGVELRLQLAKTYCKDVIEFIRFAILHEVGHIRDMKRSDELDEKVIKGEEAERIADNFAYDHMTKYYNKSRW